MIHDLLIAGGGPGGCRAAELAGRNGLKTVLLEMDKLGGVCLNCGCIPVKTLLCAARLREQMRHDAPMLGITAAELKFDPSVLWRRMTRNIERLRAGQEFALQQAGVEIVAARAALLPPDAAGNHVIEAGGREFIGKNLLLATGSRDRIPDIPGIREALAAGMAATSHAFLTQPEIPARLTVLGGGGIGLEFAALFSAFGSEVTVIESAPRIAGEFDEHLSGFLAERFRRRNIRILTGTTVREVGRSQIILSGNAALETDRLLIACGRKAFCPVPGAGGLGFKPPFRTDEKMRLAPRLYAVGDAVGNGMTASIAQREAEVAVNAILGKRDRMEYGFAPRILFTDPELASAGMTLSQARETDPDAVERRFPLTLSARYAIEHPSENGFGIAVYSGGNELLGIHLAGSGAVELLGTFLRRLPRSIPPHPSFGEIASLFQK